MPKNSSKDCKRLMTYFPTRRIESFMTSTATTGAQSNQVQARHRRDGKERNDLREEQDQARAGSTLVILTSVTSAPLVVLVVLTSSKRCLAGRAEAEVADLVVAMTLRLNSSCQSRKRTGACGAQYRWRWLRPARPVVAAAQKTERLVRLVEVRD